MNRIVTGCRAGLFWCSLTRRAGLSDFPLQRASLFRPTLSLPVIAFRVRRSRSVEPPVRLVAVALRSQCEYAQHAHDRPIVRQPLLRFISFQRLQVVLRYPRRPASGPSRFDVAPAYTRFRRRSDLLEQASSLRFFRLVCIVRTAHAARLLSRFTPARSGSFATVSLSRGVPLPA